MSKKHDLTPFWGVIHHLYKCKTIVLVFQTINNETWTTLQTCPTIYKSNPGKSIPLEMTTSYLHRPEKQHVPTTIQHVSLRLAALILYDSLHGESRICCLSHHWEMATATQRQKQHNKTKQSQQNYTKTILQSIQDTELQHLISDWNWSYTPIHPGYRAPSQNTD